MHRDAREPKAAGGLAFTDAFYIHGTTNGSIKFHGVHPLGMAQTSLPAKSQRKDQLHT
jgi:hypothetical protein